MNAWEGDDAPVPGPAGVLLLMSLALGAAAALLLTTKPGQRVREQIVDRAGGWKAQAAEAISQGREKLIASVEEQAPSGPEHPSPVREKPF